MGILTDEEKTSLSEEEIKTIEEPDDEDDVEKSDADTEKDQKTEAGAADKDKGQEEEDRAVAKAAEAAKEAAGGDDKAKADVKPEGDPDADQVADKDKDVDKIVAAETDDKKADKKADADIKTEASPASAPPFTTLKPVDPAEIDKLNEEVTDLRKKFDDGEVDYDTLMQKQREVDKLVVKNEMAQEINEQSRQGTWHWEQSHFYEANPIFWGNHYVNAAFVATVNQIIASEEAGKMTDAQVLSKAKELVEEGLGMGRPGETAPQQGERDTTAKEKADAIKSAKAELADKGKISVTLKDMPAAAGQDDDAGTWDYLDNLEGEKYQAAIDKLTTAELEQYAAAH